MALFGKKKPRVVDWTEKLQRQQEQTDSMRSEIGSDSTSSTANETSAAPFPFFAGANPPSSEDSASSYGSSYDSASPSESSVEEKRRRLGRRLLDMTNKIEDLSNQIYKLQQRLEVLERKNSPSY